MCRMRTSEMMAVLMGLSGAASLSVVDVGVHTISRLLPFENKDAYFVASPQFGVFDGVSACPQSRAYAQALAKGTSALLSVGRNPESGFEAEAQAALSQAAADASSFSGAATALLVRADLEADEPQVCCYTLGDCGCLVLRPDEAAPGSFLVGDSTDPKFHANGAPYQLAGRNFVTDKVADGESFAFPLSNGDVVLGFTDGISNNLSDDEIASIVGKGASGTAIAEELATKAKRKGLVEDDITVVLLRVGDKPPGVSSVQAAETAASPLDALTAAKAAAEIAFNKWRKGG